MKQVVQVLRDGKISIEDVPIPALSDKFILVKNSCSVISAGTEKSKVDMGNKNLIQKAKARPDLVKQVLRKLRDEGVRKTFQTVSSRLDSPSPLGYSCAGTVVAVGGLVEGLQPGDRVACGGAGYANHADYVAIPKNLAVKIPCDLSDEEASFATVGSIALQGLRLAEPKLGETFLVIGLGLIGQLSVQLLRSNGCKVLAIDLDSKLVELAEEYGAFGIYPGSNLEKLCRDLTENQGVDGVLVCAGSNSNQPIELCGRVTREKGRVVVVGAVKMDIPREDYFKKEINVVISRSYGPGRYDSSYEEGGHDYPYGYVRFTEQRNMKSFLDLVSTGNVNVKSLISHRFDVDRAEEAYDLIAGRKTDPYLAIMLNYNPDAVASKKVTTPRRMASIDKIGLSFYGGGNYSTATLLPLVQSTSCSHLVGIVTASGRTAESVSRQFGFDFCSSNFSDLLGDNTDAVVITTRHNTHADSVVQALNRGKHVYVEKPLALSIDDLSEVHSSYGKAKSSLMVGFNRRFAPFTIELIRHFQHIKSPLVVNIRVNAGEVSSDHWIQDPSVGGGRVIGEGCHFIDMASAIIGAVPVSVSAFATENDSCPAITNDNVTINLRFANGGIANIIYCSSGAESIPKEYIEVFGGGLGAIIDDFKELRLFSSTEGGKTIRHRTQDKGQRNMVNAWLDSLRSGKSCIDYHMLISCSIATIMSIESIICGAIMQVDSSILED
ncbi:bi-domain-containing oxidoreductase [uncultured Pseudoteredinibacter sp.]|uniref:bi-domain-containing oxidoreductase n=1 Tax=uncultured Pseudoteredinibacter sp. TaxID=1641701 RepID=UPI002632B15C|nr:bi-domain-containing oxidoreductase [uncultured Pseudoteredinibacter sp.]